MHALFASPVVHANSLHDISGPTGQLWLSMYALCKDERFTTGMFYIALIVFDDTNCKRRTSSKTIKADTNLSAGTIARAIKELIARGLLISLVDSKDRRRFDLTPSHALMNIVNGWMRHANFIQSGERFKQSAAVSNYS